MFMIILDQQIANISKESSNKYWKSKKLKQKLDLLRSGSYHSYSHSFFSSSTSCHLRTVISNNSSWRQKIIFRTDLSGDYEVLCRDINCDLIVTKSVSLSKLSMFAFSHFRISPFSHFRIFAFSIAKSKLARCKLARTNALQTKPSPINPNVKTFVLIMIGKANSSSEVGNQWKYRSQRSESSVRTLVLVRCREGMSN